MAWDLPAKILASVQARIPTVTAGASRGDILCRPAPPTR